MTALFPGTFDPFTMGHYDLVNQMLTFADQVVIAIGVNADKHTMFTLDQRMQHLSHVYANESRVSIRHYEGLTAHFAREVGATCIVRGVRSTTDYEYERQMADINRQLTGIETILLTPHPEHQSISSSIVRQLIAHQQNISGYIPRHEIIVPRAD